MQELINKVTQILSFKLFELKQTPVTVLSVVMFILVIAVFFIGSKLLNRVILRRIFSRFIADKGIQFTLIRIVHYLIMITGVVVAFQFVGIDLAGLTVIFGLLSVGIGFGLQNITSNFISGLILLFERPIKVGDRVTVGDIEGDVTSINMRATTIQSLDNISIIVPNSEFISSTVTNWSYGDPKIRLRIEVGVSYSSDLDTVIKALTEVAREHPDVLKNPDPIVLLSGFGDSSWDMVLVVWLGTPKRYYLTRSEINCAIVKKFRDHRVEIPFPQRDLHIRSPLPMPFSSKETA
ncbi:MAG: mechanosensitive ion channel [Candidatus Zixiibacteriota bacterium]|nr:MAG: mechanosensitive ion channel [candidate division Zixibacteria bacterium]